MKYLQQFCIIVMISFVSELMKHLIPLPVPANIYGLILMFLVLYTGIIKVEQVKETSEFLIDLMPIMFIPPAVAVMEHYKVFEGFYVQSVATIILSTFIIMTVTALTVDTIIKLRGGKKNGNE